MAIGVLADSFKEKKTTKLEKPAASKESGIPVCPVPAAK
jgi:hypothetical protein